MSAYGVPHDVYHHESGICTQSRQRIVEVPAAHYGKECKGEYAESRFCQSYECPGEKLAVHSTAA